MTIDELNKLIRDSIEAITGVLAIKYYPNAPRPEDLFATVNVLNVRKVGGLSKKFVQGSQDIDEVLIMLRVAQISVNFYRSDAMQNASMFAEQLSGYPIVEMFNASLAGVISVSDTRDLTEMFGPDQEERTQLDMFVQFELTPIINVVPGINAVSISGEVENHEGVVDQIIIP